MYTIRNFSGRLASQKVGCVNIIYIGVRIDATTKVVKNSDDNSPAKLVRQPMWISQVLGDDHTDVPCHSRCGTPKKFTAQWPRVSSIGLVCCSPLPAMVVYPWRWRCSHGDCGVPKAMVFYQWRWCFIHTN